MEMVRISNDLWLKKDVELYQAAYLKFHSVFNAEISRAGHSPSGKTQPTRRVGFVDWLCGITFCFRFYGPAMQHSGNPPMGVKTPSLISPLLHITWTAQFTRQPKKVWINRHGGYTHDLQLFSK